MTTTKGAQTTESPTLRFERETCSRCGGSGQYSWNQTTGSTCFKCDGRREHLTKRGEAAAAWLREQMMVRVDDLRPGDRIKMSVSEKYRTLIAVRPQSEGACKFIDSATGLYRDTSDLRWIDCENGGREGVRKDELVQRHPGAEGFDELMRAALSYQETLTKSGAPRKTTRA